MITLQQYSKKLLPVYLPLLVGVLLYVFGRSIQPMFTSIFSLETTHFIIPFSGWLPDYLWCFSLLAMLSLIWNGWKNIPALWIVSVMIMITSTEYFQYKHWIVGTGDWYDVVAYQLALLTHILINRKPRL
jgi:hypothetical protein